MGCLLQNFTSTFFLKIVILEVYERVCVKGSFHVEDCLCRRACNMCVYIKSEMPFMFLSFLLSVIFSHEVPVRNTKELKKVEATDF